MTDHRFLPRVLTALAAASMLAACQGGASSPPAMSDMKVSSSVGNAPQSAARSTDKHVAKTPSPSLVANPASLEFTADQAAAGTAQTVAITAKSDKKLAVTIAGTGNCPTVSPSTLSPKSTDQEGSHEGDHADAATGTITVTPNGAGPATCTITVASSSGKGGHDAKSAKGHHENDNDENDNDDAPATLTIPVIVDAPVVATPSPSPTPGR